MSFDPLSEKVNRVLYFVFLAFIALGLRVWYLTVFLHEEMSERARLPMVKTLFEPGTRGTIRDRFNLPLAINRLSYQAGVSWSALAEIPGVVWDKGKKRRLRKEYITALSHLLGRVLELDPRRVEDLIYSKAIFFGHAPCILKENLSESEYYRLKGLSPFWPGIWVEKDSKRFYPRGKVGADVLGYLGAIGRKDLDMFFQEIGLLQGVLSLAKKGEPVSMPEGFFSLDEVERRLDTIQEKAYSARDAVGVMGVEKRFETDLRGSRGKQVLEVDARGICLKQLPGGTVPKSGKRLVLSLSAELQEYAEALLASIEKVRLEAPLHAKKSQLPIVDAKAPWINGGAIVAMIPDTGEVVALASYPRFDPNSFVPNGTRERVKQVSKWLESEKFLVDVWTEKVPLDKEIFDLTRGKWGKVETFVDWTHFLEMIYGRDNLPLKTILSIDNLGKGFEVRKEGTNHPLLPSRLTLEEKLEIIDLLGLVIDETTFDPYLFPEEPLSTLKTLSGVLYHLKITLKEKLSHLFHLLRFIPWREKEGRLFLKEKRLMEKELKIWSKPYLDHFDREERRQFDLFWEETASSFLHYVLGLEKVLPQGEKDFEEPLQKELDFFFQSSKPLYDRLETIDSDRKEAYLKLLRPLDRLDRPLLARWARLASKKDERELALAFHPRHGWGTARSFAYRQATIQGSLFKLVTGWTALKEKLEELRSQGLEPTPHLLNPLTVIDEVKRSGKGWTVGRREDGTTIPQLYKGGRIPRSMRYGIGKIGLEKAIENSSNLYFSLLTADVISSPNALLKAAEEFSYGQRTGIDLPGEYRGRLPTDLDRNRTGLYATSIGQHTLVVTPLQTAVMLAAIANGGKVVEPKVALEKRDLLGVEKVMPSIKREMDIPHPVQEVLFRGMRGVVNQISKANIRSLFPTIPLFGTVFKKISPYLIGKTSTSEAIDWIGVGSASEPYQVCHSWFGGIGFEGEPFTSLEEDFTQGNRQPSLVIVVYLRFGRVGKESAPLAALIFDKWLEIKEKRDSLKTSKSQTM